MITENANFRVLVIDDSKDVHLLLKAGLRPEGLQMFGALTPAEGLRLAVEASPDLILLDVDMPGQDGFAVCTVLKDAPATRDVPVIFLTGETDIATKVRGFDVGAVDYVIKPWNVHELRARVRSALRTRHLQVLLSTRAQTDGLTGLWNRAYLDERLAEELARSRRYGSPLSLALVDIDHFKRVNDGFGHPAGDRVLQEVARTLSMTARFTDIVCRYGGEEFAIILPETDLTTGSVAAQRMCDAIRASVKRPDGASLTASIGVAGHVGRGTAADMVQAADRALYEAKTGGRDRIQAAAAP